MPVLDIRRLRGLLAEHRITHLQYAQACGLGRCYVSTILSGRNEPGELARFKMVAGLQRLGLESEARRAS
jgi:transcriptional regulator with XRE-family HTH domain